MTAIMVEAMHDAATRVGLRAPDTEPVRTPVLGLAGRVQTRRARVADVASIVALVGAWADLGLTIRRSAGDVLSSIDDFVVAELNGSIVACGALERCGGSCAHMGEIRSVSVADNTRGLGVGKALVGELVCVGEARGLGEIVLLTKTPGFFAACGFELVEPGAAPAGFISERVEQRGRTVLGRAVMRRGVARSVAGAATVLG